MFVINIENLQKLKCQIFFKKTLNLSIVCCKCDHEYKKIWQEEDSTEILRVLDLITNIEEYQNLYNHVICKLNKLYKHKSRTQLEKYRWNKKLFNKKNE